MKNFRISLYPALALLLMGMFVFSSCEKDEDADLTEEVQNIVEIASSDDSFSTLVSALSKANLATTLQGSGPFTVFAPTNDAFDQLFDDLGVSDLDDLSAAALTPILLYHVLSGQALSTNLSSGFVSTLSPGPEDTKVSLQVELGSVILNGSAQVTSADIMASNGVIHVIDEVLLPPDLVDIALNNSDFSILVQAIVKAELTDALLGDGPFTVFAPTNDAFEDLFTSLGVSGIADLTKAQLEPILLYHVVSGNISSGDLSSGDVSTLQGDNITINVGTNITINGTANVVFADIQATNGIVHVIDEVLLMEEPGTIVDIASADANFSSLVAALVKANLAGTLAGDGPFTVFAPTNAAFDQLFADLGISGLNDLSAEALTPILLYHVVSGSVMSTDLTSGFTGTLSPGPGETKVSLQVEVGSVILNGSAQVTNADIMASNGVIHVIDEVLLPPDVVDIALNNANFSILVEAVVKAELVEALQDDGPFTVFAPTNDAFEDLFTSLGVSGIEDLTKEQLEPILLYHVVSGNVLSGDLSSGDVPTLHGDNISVNVGSTVTINGTSNVILVDIQGTNGVVHVIDEVLLPH
ncbi:MAG: fasciclin domain-containing protein [Bacteroidales bacterium]|nr:fasciclin domain-containing protein [Bacteroidales bacterium]